LLPYGGHKGYALALAVQALGVFAGSGFTADKDYGYFFLAMRPDLLIPNHSFETHLREEVDRIRATPALNSDNPVRIPSERAGQLRARHLHEGVVIDRLVFDALSRLAPACQVACTPEVPTSPSESLPESLPA
jgi:LDH2 family malate/lactate/ureidoglycolate dehydrogenase